MFLYNLFRVFLWIMYVCFYRRVYFLNPERIPQKDPLIFISNHSNGFLDPILIAALHLRPVYFWARASEMPNNAKGWLFRQLHGLPIHREQEGKEHMHRNEETFQKTRNLLYSNRNSAFIAPEGNCRAEKRLRPFKTGAARLAFKMMEEKNWSIEVKILPSGVNYTYHDKFRSEVYIKLGEPISVQSYKEAYLKDSVAAVNQLTEDMWQAQRNQMIHIETEDDELVEKLLVLARNGFTRGIFPLYSKQDFFFESERKIADYVYSLDIGAKKDLEAQVDAYNALLKEKGVDDYAVAASNQRSLFWVILGFPFGVAGTISGRIPHIIARNLRDKTTPPREFSASFAFTAAFFVWILWSLIFVIAGAFFIGWWAVLLPFVMVFTQTYAYHYEDYYREWKALQNYKKVKNKEFYTIKRGAIFGQFN